MKIRIAFESEGKPEKSWYYGRILKDVNLERDGFCSESSWRMLQV